MFNAWYAAILSEELDSKTPYGIQVLGFPLVFWRHKGTTVSCAEDICPHRSAPLSVGRIDNGILECKYHGWQFGGDGACTHIPSAPGKPISKSANATTFPCVEKYGIVWVWIGDKDTSQEDLDRKFPDHLFKRHFKPEWAKNYGTRDLGIDHGLMIENLLDPAHLPFTHEGTLAKRSDAQLMEMSVIWNTATINKVDEDDEDFQDCQQTDTRGFKVLCTRPNATSDKKELGFFTFYAPSNLKLDLYTNKSKGKKLVQIQLCTPVTPTKMRLIFVFYRNSGVFANKIPGVEHMFRWYSDRIIDQDFELLGGQQVRLGQGANPWRTAVSADTGGVLYRKWRDSAEKLNPWFGSYNARKYMALASSSSSSGLSDIEDLDQSACSVRFAEPPSSRFKVRPNLPLFPDHFRRKVYALLVLIILSILYLKYSYLLF